MIEFWKGRKTFEYFIEQELLDFALFDALANTDDLSVGRSQKDREPLLKITTQIRKEEITPGSCKNPMIFLANRVINVLPHDSFIKVGHQMREMLMNYVIHRMEDDPRYAFDALKTCKWTDHIISPSSECFEEILATSLSANEEFTDIQLLEAAARRGWGIPPSDEERSNYLLAKSVIEDELESQRRQSEIFYYRDPLKNQVLDSIFENSMDSASFSIPLGGFNLLSDIRAFATRGSFVVIGDEGETSLDAFEGLYQPRFNLLGGTINCISDLIFEPMNHC